MAHIMMADFSANAFADFMMDSTVKDSTAANSTVADSTVADSMVADSMVADSMVAVIVECLKINARHSRVCAVVALLLDSQVRI
jgi:hypothetical protein